MNIPKLGFGTYRLIDEVAYKCTKQAIAMGYRHIDTAQIYHNEAPVGQAIKDSKVARNAFFVTTKVWNDQLSQKGLVASVKESLRKLQLDSVDLLLVHWPAPPEGVSMTEYLHAMIDAQSQGLCTKIGVSNFTIAQLKQAAEIIGVENIYLNQVEVHPYLQNCELIQYCDAKGIAITAYMPFAYGKVLKDQVINDIAQKHSASPAQVVLSWIRQLGLSTIPSSTNTDNMQSNLDSQRLVLDHTDMHNIAKLNRNDRQANPDFAPNWD